MTLKKEELLNKGWSNQEIERAEAILEKTEQKDVFLSKIVFWSALAVTILGNILVSVVVIPLLIAFNVWALYSVTIVLALSFGFLYTWLINDIGHLGKHHHILAGIVVPIIALTNVLILTTIGNQIALNLQTQAPHENPFLLGLVFAVAFILPYLVGQIIKLIKK
ncbi:hypothetical protein HOC13_03645 [Candidatus Woesearchaeota archaeon]|jgi:hypothetical protein|nr:hypothetical protein [Candidatus Woesearchaeota archaeon]